LLEREGKTIRRNKGRREQMGRGRQRREKEKYLLQHHHGSIHGLSSFLKGHDASDIVGIIQNLATLT
jgi:hypothetical protein